MYLPGDMYYPSGNIESFAASAAESSIREAGASNGLFLVAVAIDENPSASRGSALSANGC
ncbi:MAG: hypothetical protein CME44_10645 [Haliea sp.]|nr:hypothetical protein [Haliea sp.]HAN69236.1 hypothetical protein [Halieaceae bacterium]MBK41646.1 hypothetical protein [Haliea sp.]MBP70908.1 hypothetical protein [Haliea sp.]HBX72466.1 hypothetical protein [Halieaceae bacterium]